MSSAIISAKKVQGSEVVSPAGDALGHVEDLMIDKVTGRIVYAVLTYGGLLGLGEKHFALPWEALDYSVDRAAYVLDVDPDLLERAPGFRRDQAPDMSDRRWGEQIHQYYGFEPYWTDRPSGRPLRTGSR